MRACWEALHASFVRSVTTLKADQSFRIASAREPVLARFESPAGLIEYLTTKTDRIEDHEQKNAIYAALVRAVQAGGVLAELASALLWCGLWRGLDGIYRHRLRHFKAEPEELVAAISAAFTSLVGGMVLGRVQRIAATLVRSTDRDLMEALRRDWSEREHVQANGDTESGAEEEPAAPIIADSALGLPPGLSLDAQVAALRGWLLDVAGEDGDLLLAVLVFEENQREAGERLGLSHEAARKRFQRAFERVAKVVSQSASETRVSGSRARKPGGAD